MKQMALVISGTGHFKISENGNIMQSRMQRCRKTEQFENLSKRAIHVYIMAQ